MENSFVSLLNAVKYSAKILAAIPATFCSAERSFSALRRIKTSLRNRMGEQRLSDFAILNIERDSTNYIEENMMDAIIDEFARKNDGQANLLCHN